MNTKKSQDLTAFFVHDTANVENLGVPVSSVSTFYINIDMKGWLIM